jgi:SAM-dependent methyltransferase
MGRKQEDDAYGQLIWDHYHGLPAQEIIEREDGWIGTSSGPAFYFAEYPDWGGHEREAMKHVCGRVIDIGCGAGRHALYLQEKGFYVLGIDLSPLAIEVSKARGLKNAKLLGIDGISRELEAFGTFLMMGSNFGLFGNLSRARRLLKRFHAMSGPEGRIIAESADPCDTENPYHLAYQKWNRERGKFPCQLRIRVRHETLKSAWFEYLKVSRDEMRGILAGTGWEVERFIPEKGTVYTAVMRKTASGRKSR